jgi:hypothetical protein
MTMERPSQALERQAERLVPAPVAWAARAVAPPAARQDKVVALAARQEAPALAAGVPWVARAAEAAEGAPVEAALAVELEPAQSTAERAKTARAPFRSRAAHSRKAR